MCCSAAIRFSNSRVCLLGCVFPEETGLYYLQSRYYNPAWGRFISADGQISGVGGNIIGYNMFAYCFNNPVNMVDEYGNWPSWKNIKKSLKNFATKLLSPVELQIGFGQGFGINFLDTLTAGFSRDTYFGIDDNNAIMGNVITSEISVFDSKLSIGDTYNHKVEENGERISNSGKPTDGPFDMMNYPDVTHGNEFAMPLFALNSEGELLLNFSIGAHFGIGGHIVIAYNVSEMCRLLK